MEHLEINIEGFVIQDFEMKIGTIFRFWIEVVPTNSNKIDSYKVSNSILEKYPNFKKCPIKIKLDFFDSLKNLDVKTFIEKRFKDKSIKILHDLKLFEIEPNYKLKKLGTAHNKILAIINHIEKFDFVAYDYYGLSPDTEIKLTNYVINKTKENKTFIAFDNLDFKRNIIENVKIKDIDVIRT